MARCLQRGEKLLIASHNPGKLVEICEMVAPFGLSVVSAADLGLDEPDETGATFEENAALKANAAIEATGLPSLADDSGLAVEALGGAPGINSARWAGPEKDFTAAMDKVGDQLRSIGADRPEDCRASFVAVLCLAFSDGERAFFRGEVAGTLVYPPRGTGGFGYDPMFVPDGYDQTFGELPPEIKARLSHRVRAFAKFTTAVLSR